VELDLLAARRGKSCEFIERPKWREAQGTRAVGMPSVPPFFWVHFFGGANKCTSPGGETQTRIKLKNRSLQRPEQKQQE
jgi:hypothetical protein